MFAHQAQAFRKIVQHAESASPFYRDLNRSIDLDAGFQLSHLPVIDKRRLMENFDAVVTDQRLRRVDLDRHLANAVRDEKRCSAPTALSQLRVPPGCAVSSFTTAPPGEWS